MSVVERPYPLWWLIVFFIAVFGSIGGFSASAYYFVSFGFFVPADFWTVLVLPVVYGIYITYAIIYLSVGIGLMVVSIIFYNMMRRKVKAVGLPRTFIY